MFSVAVAATAAIGLLIVHSFFTRSAVIVARIPTVGVARPVEYLEAILDAGRLRVLRVRHRSRGVATTMALEVIPRHYPNGAVAPWSWCGIWFSDLPGGWPGTRIAGLMVPLWAFELLAVAAVGWRWRRRRRLRRGMASGFEIVEPGAGVSARGTGERR